MENTNNMNQNLLKRGVSALVMAGVLLSILSLGGYYMIGLLIVITTFMLAELLVMFRNSKHLTDYAPVSLVLVFGFYTVFSMFSWHDLYTEGGQYLILWLVILVASNDTAAYAVGKIVQGPKLVPSISPGKTWSGLLGGLIIGTTIAYCTAPYLIKPCFWSIPLCSYKFVLLCLCFSVMSHLGDLFESALKRFYGVKDSGSLIPGHGGVLDRMDSYLIISLVARFFFS